jgi:TetR/AcrR family transcriptional regulator
MPSPLNLCSIVATVGAKRARRKEARPGELLAAALDLFVEKGFAATRAEEVAKRAGVSKGTLFLYFSSKEELFKAVVRENISGRFGQWGTEIDQFQGSTADMLRMCMLAWWERIGSTKASGITKLMLSEAGNFPELATFYRDEVIRPGNELIKRILQRGVDRGEFRPMNMKYAVYTVLGPMLFLALWKHSYGTLSDAKDHLAPQEYLAAQIDAILLGMHVRGEPATHTPQSQPLARK